MTRNTPHYNNFDMMMMRQGWPMHSAPRRSDNAQGSGHWCARHVAAAAVIAAVGLMTSGIDSFSWAGDTTKGTEERTIMPNSTSIERVQKAWGHLGEGKLDDLADMYSADMVLVIPGQQDRIEGRTAFRSALETIGAALPPGFDIKSMHYFEGAEGVMQTLEWTSENLPEGSQSAILWRFNDRGEITEERWFVDTEQWKAAF